MATGEKEDNEHRPSSLNSRYVNHLIRYIFWYREEKQHKICN